MTNPFPTKGQLLQALRSRLYDRHELLDYAHELTALHERRLCAEPADLSEIDSARRWVAQEIDRWVLREVPPAHGAASIHTETMGSVFDRLAQLTACAYAALAGDGVGEWELCGTWERLAELAVAYEDLSMEVSAGRRRLPGGR